MVHVKQSEYPVRLGQVLDLTITGYTSEGQGVARVEGLAVTENGGKNDAPALYRELG